MPTQIHDPAIFSPAAGTAEGSVEVRRQAALLKTGALQNAILNSPNFSIIVTDEKGIIQLFNVGAERASAESRTRNPDYTGLRGIGVQGLARDRRQL